MIFSEKSETPNLTDYLKAKPDSVVYYGDKKSTASWRLLYFIALKLIAAKHPDELMRLEGKSILGDKIEIGSEIEIREFSHPLGIMQKPDGKWFFAETDFNAHQILLRLKKLMEICKDPLDTMVIYFSANQSQNVSLRTDKSDSPLIRKSLAEIFRPEVAKAVPTVTLAEQQYVQWLIQKGEKPSEVQTAFSMTEKVINRLQISAKRLFSVTSAVELKYILSALRRTPQWHYFSSRQQNQIVHTIDLYREFRESSAKALANAQAASTVQPPATTSTSHPSVLPAPALSGSQKISSPEKFSCAGANPLEVLFDGKHIEAKTWKDVYVAGVKELYSRYPQKFISLIGDPDNKTGVYIETAYRAHKLKGLKVLTKNSAGQWLYLETEKTPDEAMTSLYKLLDHCGVAHTALSVQCKKAESDVPVTVTDVSIPQVVSSAPAKPIAKPVAAPVEKTAVRTPPNANSSAFYQWMRNEMHLAESSSRSYVSAINNCEQLARQIGLDSTALYGVSLDVATRTKDLLTATKEYTATNARQNNRLRAALAKYIQYLSVPESGSAKKEPLASKPVATPVQAPAVISPVSQKLIQDVEKVVLDADLDGTALSDLYGKIHASDNAIREAVLASSKIVSLAGKLYHEDAFVDWDDGASQMEQLLEKLMERNNGYVSDTQLYEYVLLNNAYRHGIYRVGCKVCPMSAKWQDSLISFNYPDEVKSQLRMLEDMTLFAKGKIDKKYIEDGGWQARAGGKILKQGENRVSEEITATSIVFRIKNARQNWNSVLPIWGIPVDDDGKRITVKTKHGNFEMNYREENGQQIVSISPFFQLDRFDISTLRSIANKTAYCVGCKACTPQCPTGAYQIIDGKIVIRANRCVHCYNCCTYTDKGCMVAKSLFVRGENMENPDKYRNFGFRQSFYSHFVDTGVDCFDLPDQDKVLGKDQYKALKQWVAESGILKIETKGSKKVVLPELTVLGNKLINIGVYNPFGWAVMWANLAYNSIVVNAFCLNIGVGETFNKDDIVGILKYDNATACDHAANSLLSTFRDSPIGSSLMQGIQLDKDYYRAGWEYPHAVALLYALYLYAEHTGRKSFTFSELVNAHSNPDAKGISPADIYGIDVKKFREDVQGLAISFPKHIRVSFVANLDNIILEDYSSDDIIDLAEE